MIPILYEHNETEFVSNGICRLRDCIFGEVTEERNGIYECNFSYPVDGANFEQIQVGRIIAVTHDETGDVQPFDIVGFTRPIEGAVEFHAVHISYRQSGITVTAPNSVITSVNKLSAAFDIIKDFGQPENPFTYAREGEDRSGDVGAADGIPHSVKQFLGGMDGSVLDTYGGEYEFDKFTVILHRQRGTARDFAIRYGVNMIDYNEEYDAESTYSSCVPYWTDGTEIVIGDLVESGSNTLLGARSAPLDLSDKFEEKPTKEQLTVLARSYMINHMTYAPGVNIKVSFALLRDLGEFDTIKNLYQCNLCDTIEVIFDELYMRYKVVKVVWDFLSGRYTEMELGQLSTSLSEALGISTGTTNLSEGGGGSSDISFEFKTESKSYGNSAQRVTMTSGTSPITIFNLTSTVDGYVFVSGNVQMTANSNGNRHAQLYIGGAIVSQETQAAHGTQTAMIAVNGTYPVSVGESVQIRAWQSSGSTLYAGGNINALFMEA